MCEERILREDIIFESDDIICLFSRENNKEAADNSN